MKLKLKKRGLLYTEKSSFNSKIESITTRTTLEGKKYFQICYKGKKASGIIELSQEELGQMLPLMR